jgi:putative transposase
VARPLRIETPGGTYHVTARGNAGRDIYLDDGDRVSFLALVSDLVERFAWNCFAYCLMHNHYHLVVRTPRGDLSRGMRHLNGVYAQRFHRKHGTFGHLFQGRFHATLVQDDPYLLAVLRYVARNPVEAGLCNHASEWRWSSHRAVLGLAPTGPVAVQQVLAFCGEGGKGRTKYRRLVEEADRADRPPIGAILGDDEFASRHVQPLRPDREVPVRHYERGRPRLSELLSEPSVEAIAAAYFQHRYRMREIAAALGCHYTTVSRRLREWKSGRDA